MNVAPLIYNVWMIAENARVLKLYRVQVVEML